MKTKILLIILTLWTIWVVTMTDVLPGTWKHEMYFNYRIKSAYHKVGLSVPRNLLFP